MRFTTPLKHLVVSERGFSLVEVMVAVGIGSIVTLGVAYMMENAAKLKIESEAQIERNQLSLLFDSVLIDPENCDLSIMPSDPGEPDTYPVPAGRLYTSDIEHETKRRIPGLKIKTPFTAASDPKERVVLDLSGLPTTPLRLDRSRLEITDVYLTNFKIINWTKIYDPNAATVDFVPRDTINVPTVGTYDLVVEYNKIGRGVVDDKGNQVVRKPYSITKVVPINIAQERPKQGSDTEIWDNFEGKAYISGCRLGEDVAAEDVERLVCDNLAGGSEIRNFAKNSKLPATGPSAWKGPRWGKYIPAGDIYTGSTYVDCKDIRNVRQRLLKMLMCDELNGDWDEINHRCLNQFPAKGINCPTTPSGELMVVYGIYPGNPNPSATEPLPSPPGDFATELIECRPPCTRFEEYLANLSPTEAAEPIEFVPGKTCYEE